MHLPKVSVIIPTRNRADFLRDAIQSVLSQELNDLELIVVDDGSTDGTAELIGAINDPRLRFLRQPHRGISAAMNAGTRAARGDYIARLDSDDLWQPEMLATLVPILEEQPDIGVVYAKGQAIDSKRRVLRHIQGMPERFPGDSLRSVVYDDCTANAAMVVRRTCFDRVGLYDETVIANEDWDIRLRLARHYRFCFVDKVLAHIRWHDGNITGPRSPQLAAVLNSRTTPLDRLFSDPDLPLEVRAMKSIAYTNVYLFRWQRWLQAGNFRRAWHELALAISISDERMVTGTRAIWFAFVVPILCRSAFGRHAVDALAEWRRKRRTLRSSSRCDE